MNEKPDTKLDKPTLEAIAYAVHLQMRGVVAAVADVLGNHQAVVKDMRDRVDELAELQGCLIHKIDELLRCSRPSDDSDAGEWWKKS